MAVQEHRLLVSQVCHARAQAFNAGFRWFWEPARLAEAASTAGGVAALARRELGLACVRAC
eukprot:13907007-Alexandrium_andersonii.AAC.1